MGRRWVVVLSLAATLLVCFAAMVHFVPFWLLDRVYDIYMLRHGIAQHDVAVGEYRIHYLEAKPRGSGPERPIVLIHGLGARASNWVSIIPQLAANGYHVYALDLLGYGDSPKPAGGDYSLAGEERIAVGFMRAINVPTADVAGWSMGGWIAMKLALDHPEVVRRLLVYDTAGLFFNPDFPLSLFAPTNREELDTLIRKIEPNKPFIRAPAIAVHGMLRTFRKNQPVVDASFRSMLTGNELLDFRVHNLAMPMLIVWGAEDNLIPMSMGLHLHQLVPQSVFVGIGGCGHLTIAECGKQAMPPTLKFLAADPPEPPSTTYLPSLR